MEHRKGISGKSRQKQSFKNSAEKFLRYEKGTLPLKKSASVRIALVYPNSYGVGMANLGFQTVYRLFNEHPEVRCERAFDQCSSNSGIRTLESKERLDRFDVVAFSLSFEIDILNLICCLKKSNITLLAEDRREREPLILVGGAVASINPSPLLSFVDGLLVGEGEDIFQQIADVLFSSLRNKICREEKLLALGKISGVFIPRFHTRVKRHIIPSLEAYPIYTPIVTPLSHFANMFVVEVGRGCTRGCFFCAAQKVYYPLRFHSAKSILETIEEKNPGATRIGLEGAGLSDYPELEGLCEALVSKGHEVSFSSIRADRVTPGLIKILNRGNVRSFAMAPEAGSELLRNRIGKGISDEVLERVTYLLRDSSIETLKLYFLIGLPGETIEDVEAIVKLVKKLSSIFVKKGKRKRIRLSVNAFIPKPFTEFQWAPMASLKELSAKRKYLRQGLSGQKEIFILPKSSREEILQGLLSLGDINIGLVMMDAVENQVPWKSALKNRGIDIETILHHERVFGDTLPWDFIDYKVPKEKLWKRYKKNGLLQS